MFSPSASPRVFKLPLGVDFGTALINGLAARCANMPPHDVARIEIFVNTRRTARRLKDLMVARGFGIMPRIRLISDIATQMDAAHIPLPVAPLRRRLDLYQLVRQLIQTDPDLAPASSAFDLSDSLARLIDEMQGEGVNVDDIAQLDVSDQSGHWERSLRFITLAKTYLDSVDQRPDMETRQRLVIESLAETWSDSPPNHPIIIAGSTGSRGATALLMEAVSKLPQGAVILPGVDIDQPEHVWANLKSAQDHPQYRYFALMQRLNLAINDLPIWDETEIPAAPDRNALVSLALRPAPITDQWLVDGPNLQNLGRATSGLTLIEAPSPRSEAETIALRLRQAIEDGQTAALISPDRMLTRQVAAALDRWDITPDDSAGQPLALSPPGRFLRHVMQLFGQPASARDLLILLKHPLCHSESDRNQHLLRTRELELKLRRYGPPCPSKDDLVNWAKRTGEHDQGRLTWAEWLGDCLDYTGSLGDAPLSDLIARHMELSTKLSQGPDGSEGGELWRAAAGRKALAMCEQLATHSDGFGDVSIREYQSLFQGLLHKEEVRDRDAGHPNVLIWGTLEARVQNADLIILGALNETTWPSAADPDPWLNRQMRMEAGLLLPDRQIGLSAHDFQQAIAGKEVWLSRSIRSSDADAVPSRWINRLTNLLNGLRDQNGPELLNQMRQRGDHWIAMAHALSQPQHSVPTEKRPSPKPPIDARPRQLSVTQIKTLVRDPYAIYARKVLGLSRLDPIDHVADAPMRGTITHKILEIFIKTGVVPDDPTAKPELLRIAGEVLSTECPWPATRRLWLARIERVADWFLTTEINRQQIAQPTLFEANGEMSWPEIAFLLTCNADRIDVTDTGRAVIYDYKTGNPPTEAQQKHFDKQLLLECAMVEAGAFEIGSIPAQSAHFIGLGATPKAVDAPLTDIPVDRIRQEFINLIRNWDDPDRGYTARLAHMMDKDVGDYDHLSRYGEWDMTQLAEGEDLK